MFDEYDVVHFFFNLLLDYLSFFFDPKSRVDSIGRDLCLLQPTGLIDLSILPHFFIFFDLGLMAGITFGGALACFYFKFLAGEIGISFFFPLTICLDYL